MTGQQLLQLLAAMSHEELQKPVFIHQLRSEYDSPVTTLVTEHSGAHHDGRIVLR